MFKQLIELRQARSFLGKTPLLWIEAALLIRFQGCQWYLQHKLYGAESVFSSASGPGTSGPQSVWPVPITTLTNVNLAGWQN